MILTYGSLQLYKVSIQFIHFKRPLLPLKMPKEQQQQIFHFILTLVSVKMKVKFPCKMAIQKAGHPITNEVLPNEEGKFMFNQDIRLRQESQKLFTELNICLITDKGARYLSGIAKLYHNEILRSEGERLVITLSKCLDAEAFCELRVDKVIKEGGKKRTLTTIQQINQKHNNQRGNEERNYIAELKSPKKYDYPHVGSQTKSQAHFPVTNNFRPRKQEQEFRSRQHSGIGLQVTHRKFGNASPKGKNRPIHSKNKHHGQQINIDLEHDKMLEAEVYKDNYQKLKQKYLKEAENSKNQLNKRIMLQNNQNNFKLEIVRLKIRNEELQKNISEKSARLKEIASSLAFLQGAESQVNMMREDIAGKEHAINIMEDTIITLSRENDQLRSANKEITYKLDEKIMMLENEIEINQSRSCSKQQQLERDIKMLTESLQYKDNELAHKNQMLEKQKKNVYDLERSIQNKLFEFDSQLQNQRISWKQKIDDAKFKIEEANQNMQKIVNEKNNLVSQLDRLKGILLKNEYEFKLYQQEMNGLRNELEELKSIKDKHNELVKQIKIISEHKTILEKNHQKIILSKESTLEEVTSQYKRQAQFLRKNNKELEEKCKILSSKLIEVQGQLQFIKGSLEKSKKSQQNISKEYAELKEKQKGLKKNLKIKQQQCQDGKKELFRLKEKNQTVFQSIKNQISKLKQELSKNKIQLESQIIKNQQLVQTNSQLNMQLARLKMTQQFGQQRYEKLMTTSQEKYSQFQKIIKQHEGVIELLQEKVKLQKNNEKDYFSQFQKRDYEINLVVEKNQKVSKEVKILEEKNKQLDNNLKSKQVELIEAQKRISTADSKLNENEQKIAQFKDQLRIVKSQLQKNKKIIEIMQKDYEKAKSDITNYSQKLNEKEKQIDEKVQQIKRNKQSISLQENTYSSMKKQYDRFKDSVSQALNGSFAQILSNFAVEKGDNLKSTTFSSVESISKRGITSISNDLISAINIAGKQNKNQLTKLTDKIKSLEKDLEIVRGEFERSQQSSKRQLIEKNYYIQQIEEEIRNIKNQKGETQVHSQLQIGQLEEQLKHYQNDCKSLSTDKNQLEFSLNGLRMELERLSEEYEKKYSQFRKQRNQIEQKLQYQCHNTQISQSKFHELQIEMMNLNSILMSQKQENYKKEVKLSELSDQNQKIMRQIQSLKRLLKQSEEKYSEIEIQFITVCQIKQKYQSMLSQEESKLKDIRSFNNSILKEKQQIIKKQLEKNLQITNLQNAVSELRHYLTQEQDSKSKYKADFDDCKEQAKKYSNQIKEMDITISQEKLKYGEMRDKLRQKQQSLVELREEYANYKKKVEQNNLKNNNIIQELKEENDMISRQLDIVTSQSNENARSLESQLSKTSQNLQTSKQQIAQLEQAIFIQRQNNQLMQESINKLKIQNQDLKKRLQEVEKVYEDLMEENRQKDEHMFEMGGKIYQYQSKIREIEEDKQRQLEELNNNLNVKYDEDYQEIYQKIEFIEKEKEYFKEKYNERQEEINKKNKELKHKEIEENQFKKIYQEKIKKLEEDKLQIFTDKNKEINKILQDNKSQFQSIRVKQSDNRKITHELEIARSTIQKMDAKIKQAQNDKNTQIKAYQSEIQNLRKKEQGNKSYRDSIRSNQWTCERQVRKLIQNYIKKVLQIGEREIRNQNNIGLIKNLEEGILTAVSIFTKE